MTSLTATPPEDDREAVREQPNFRLLGIIATLNKSIVSEKRKRPYIPEQAWDVAMAEIERLITQQVNAALDAVDAGLPSVNLDGSDYNFVRKTTLDEVHQLLQALRREVK